VSEPRWITRTLLDVIHFELIREHGGAAGVRDGGDDLIESALVRPRQRLEYEPESDLSALAAAYLYGLAKNHGYLDGNKRVAFAAAAVFLVLNGRRLSAPEVEAYDAVIGLVEGRYSEDDVAEWIRRNLEDTAETGGA
jgi:death-on-curing protein